MKQCNQRLNCEIDEVKVNVALANNQRDVLLEKKRIIEQQEKWVSIASIYYSLTLSNPRMIW